MQGLIKRRILVNYRVDPERLSVILPAPFSPQLVNGHGVAGICLIRLEQLRPKGFPVQLGFSSENAAHRIAVEWKEGEALHKGVFIPRRDTNSRFAAWAGGKLFPTRMGAAEFETHDELPHHRVSLRSHDGCVSVRVSARRTDAYPQDSVFSDLDSASAFFKKGGAGYSGEDPQSFPGVELKTNHWEMIPLQVQELHSSFFEDEQRFPKGSALFDNALLMWEIPHEWHALRPIVSPGCVSSYI
jgi:Uncharacterized conserved protein (COG2071)